MFDFVTHLWIANVAISLPMVAFSLANLYWSTYAWHSPVTHEETTSSPARNDVHQHTFSVIVPLREEPIEVVGATIAKILAQTHPAVQPVCSVGYDDPDTLAVVRRLMDLYPGRITLAVSQSDVRNKPTQLNAALAACTGDVVGILDAESLSAPGLLSQIDATLQDPEIGVVQGGVMIVNHRASWVALRSSLEYYANHRSKMHFAAAHHFMLMGGNTVFFRRSLLDEVGGWDPEMLTEDAEIGVRLSVLGHDVRVAYQPHLVSREEAPTTIRSWVKQRTRWNLGFMQTIRKGVWRQLPTAGRRRFARWLLWQPSIMAISGVIIPLGVVVALFAPSPLWATMIAFLPAVPTVMLVVLDATMLYLFGREIGEKVRLIDYLLLVVTTPIYQLMSAYAAARAAVKYLLGDLRWEKTAHTGSHIEDIIDLTVYDRVAS
ncbi:MAG: glycosyltransferase [Acidobacteriota bacterium]|nr:glycosyltransferase [Acidobacteriota bacterium]